MVFRSLHARIRSRDFQDRECDFGIAGQTLTWTLGSVKPGQKVGLTVDVKATKTGKFNNCATVTADLGLTVGGLLGPKLPRGYRESVSGKYPGLYGKQARQD